MPIDHNLIAGIGQRYNRGLEQGQRNRLLAQEAEREEQFRNTLAEYVGPDQAGMAEGGGGPDNQLPGAGPVGGQLPPEAVNELMAIDPERANQLVAGQQQQEANRQQLQQQTAREAYQRMQFVSQSENPAQAMRIAGRMSDGSDFIESLVSQGLVDPAAVEDGISDQEAREWAQIGMQTYGPMAGLQEERAEPSLVREMDALGYPRSAEGLRQFQEDRGVGSSEELDRALTMLQISGEQARQARERREAQEAEREREREQVQQSNAINRSLNQTTQIAEYTSQLEDSMLQAGVPFAEGRRQLAGVLAGAGSVAGVDVSGLESDIAAFDTLKKNMNDQLINLMNTGGLSRSTNAILQQYQNSLASPETSPRAILAIQANIGETLLDEADASDIEVENRDQIEQSITRMRGYAGPQGATAEQIGGMGIEQLRELDLEALTEDQREAVSNRLENLGL